MKFTNKLRYIAFKSLIRFFRLFFKIDGWHGMHNRFNRPYKQDLINYLQENKFNNVLEIGCGIGEIIGNSKAKKSLGLDIDNEVVKLATLLYPKTRFITGDANIIDTSIHYDCVVIVNWIHNFDLNYFVNIIYPKIKSAKVFILDEIVLGTPGYMFYHQFNTIFSECNRKILGTYDNGCRQLVIYIR